MKKNNIAGVVVLAVALCVAAHGGHAQESQRLTTGFIVGYYGSRFDSIAVWHPERIYIKWNKMRLDIRLPYERNRSGVANLLFRDRASGEVRLLDTIRGNPDYGTEVYNGIKSDLDFSEIKTLSDFTEVYRMDNTKHRRYANSFAPGGL